MRVRCTYKGKDHVKSWRWTQNKSRQRRLSNDFSIWNSTRAQPLKPQLSGLQLEYRLLQLYSRDTGKREAQLSFSIGQGTQDIGFRNAVPILFDCVAATQVTLGIKDHDDTPTTAALVIRDKQGRIYPNPARRLAPDFFFHNQVYRADGETIMLPPGEYTASISRGTRVSRSKANIHG